METETKKAGWTREQIQNLLLTSNRAVELALVGLFARQTSVERSCEATIDYNDRGFCPADAEIFSSFAKQVNQGWHLTDKQLAVARRFNKKGICRLARYSRQLDEIIREKEVRTGKMYTPPTPLPLAS